MSKLSGAFPKASAGATPDDAARFIGGAPSKAAYPWENLRMRAGTTRAFSTRIDEEMCIRLDWLAEQPLADGRRVPKRELVERALTLLFAEEMEKRGIPEDRR